MAFETPLTIMSALQEIDRNVYALPALQREFVWKPAQICELFDSVMKGYPIGSFLFWKLEPETTQSFKFYKFMRDYHERDRPFCDEYPMHTMGPQVAVLDGQQRLTAFHIALYGSYASKRKYLRRDSPKAYPVKHLYLNLLFDPRKHEDADYQFEFLSPKEAQRRDDTQFWYKVGDIRTIEAHECALFLLQQDLEKEQFKTAATLLGGLFQKMHGAPLISYFLEREQDLDKVLNIFIRINSGGTKLSYADLLLSMATAQWSEIDARKAINDLTVDMNSYGAQDRFNFSKDFILKAGLTLTGQASVKFTSKNFTVDKMRDIESSWGRISDALLLTAQLLHDFGVGRKHLRATSAAIVIASYLYYKGYDEHFLSREANAREREQIKRWFIQMNLSTIWAASFADKLLPKVVAEFERAGTFDCAGLLDLTRRLGRDPYLDAERIEELLELSYADSRTFFVLSVLFDSMQAQTLHGEVDHIYPRSLTSKKKLERQGFEAEAIERIKDRINRLPNLWLLAQTTNREKGAKMPLKWLGEIDAASAEDHKRFHHLQDLVEDLHDFDTFYEARKQRLRPLLLRALGRPQPAAAPSQEATEGLEEHSAAAIEVSGTLWDDETLGILEESYHPLAQVLMAAGIPQPQDVDRDILLDGLTTQHRSIMNWSVRGAPVLLVSAHTPQQGLSAQAVTLGEDLDEVARELKHALELH